MKKKSTNTLLLLCVLILVAVIYYSFALPNKPCPSESYQSTQIEINGHKLLVDIALTEDQRTCGLAHRNKLPDNYGMLFVFEENQTLDFWMKDTYIPLIVAYIDEHHRIIEMHQFSAEQDDIDAPSKSPGRYALESSPGWFIKNNIAVGDYVKFTLP